MRNIFRSLAGLSSDSFNHKMAPTGTVILMVMCDETACFRTEWESPRGGDMRFHIHLQSDPPDVSAGIHSAESVIREAVQAMGEVL